MKVAGASANEAYRSFQFGDYATLIPLLVVQWLFLILGLNMGATWGMAVAGTIARWIVGDAALDYPGFLQLLPLTFSYVESASFILVGAFALPRLAAHVMGRTKAPKAQVEAARARVGAAILPTFLALLGAFLVTYAWQLYASRGLHALLAPYIQGWVQSAIATWIVSVAVGYAITTYAIYVPIVAVSESLSPVAALKKGVGEGWKRFRTTYPYALLLSLPALLLQLFVQIGGAVLSNRTRPENVAYLLLAYVVASTVATYFVWSMATRYYVARTEAA
ncbi:MAG TPA: hypothetical protein VFU59_04540 [Candidatus Eisenbacteria bacterium]|nr:hypothetical protein [Candidatus Eisenbacteria bacterium]